MSFFQNVFDFEFRPTLLGADRQYQVGWKLAANANRSDYMLSGNAGPFDLSALSVLTINYAYDPAFMNFSSLAISVAGATPAVTTPEEVITLLNSDDTFSSLFLATLYPSTTIAGSPNKILIKGKRSRGNFRAYISNTGAEQIIQFNKHAPISELPSYFERYTIDERFNYPKIGPDRVIMLNPADSYEASLIDAAGYNSASPKADWQLLYGQNDAYWFYKRTYVASKLATEIKYPAGAVAGDLAKKTQYEYSGSDLVAITEIPYVLQSGDLVTPP